MKNNCLIIPKNISDTKESRQNFLFPLKGFCVGHTFEVTFDVLDGENFILINRILDKEGIFSLEQTLLQYQDKIKGIVFEDLGIFEIVKKFSKKVELIYFPSHAMCSYHTFLACFDFCDSIVISPDITKAEMEEILKKVHDVSFYLYGPLPYLYSRRTLLTNFGRNQNVEIQKIHSVSEKISEKHFTFVENEFGTVCYDQKNFDGRELLSLKNVKYYLLDLEFTEYDNLEEWLNNFFRGAKIDHTTSGFLYQKTIYLLPSKGGTI